MEKYSGRCRCEKITFKVSGEPTWKVNCNCNWCQTTSGSAFRSFVIFNEDDITYLNEHPASYEDTKTEHGRPMTNLFCSTCGTIDQRKDINITCNIWGQEALQFTGYSKDAEVYKTGYWGGTGEKM